MKTFEELAATWEREFEDDRCVKSLRSLIAAWADTIKDEIANDKRSYSLVSRASVIRDILGVRE